MYSVLRKSRRSALFFSILLFLASVITLCSLPPEPFRLPRPLNYKSRYEAFYNSNLPWVSVSVPDLYSTGLEYQKDSFTHFVLYYTLYDQFCQFYLIPEKIATGNPVLSGRTLTGHLIKLGNSEYETLLSQMAKKLPWKKAKLRKTTSPYVVSVGEQSLFLIEGSRLLALTGLFLSSFRLFLLFQRMRRNRRRSKSR